MLFGLELIEVIRTVGALGIAFMIFAESGLLLGFFLPGDTLLFTAGFLATNNLLGVSIHMLVLILIAAAITGQSVGYWFGAKAGPRIFRRKSSAFFHPDNITRAEKFYEQYGPVTILLARFVPVVRTFVPIVAGVAKMNYKTFTFYNILGALLWAGGVTYFGYFAGGFFEARGITIDHLILPIIGLVVLLTGLSPIIHTISSRRKRTFSPSEDAEQR